MALVGHLDELPDPLTARPSVSCPAQTPIRCDDGLAPECDSAARGTSLLACQWLRRCRAGTAQIHSEYPRCLEPVLVWSHNRRVTSPRDAAVPLLRPKCTCDWTAHRTVRLMRAQASLLLAGWGTATGRVVVACLVPCCPSTTRAGRPQLTCINVSSRRAMSSYLGGAVVVVEPCHVLMPCELQQHTCSDMRIVYHH